MSYVFFKDVLAALGKKVEFESISNLYGKTTFDKKQGKEISNMIAKANPLYKPSKNASAAAFLAMPGDLKVIDSNNKEQANKALGGIGWFEDFLK